MDPTVDLTAALGVALAPAAAPAYRPGSGSGTRLAMASAAPAAPAAAPVFQMAALPAILDPATYAGAEGNLNPNGSYLALRALRDLVDPVPLFSRTYLAGPGSTEDVWAALLGGASATGAFGSGVLDGAKKAFANAALAGTDGLAGTWRPVYASPPDWANLADGTAYVTVTVDLTGTATGARTTKLATIGGGAAALEWTTVDADGGTTTTPVTSGTSLDSITLEIRQVTLRRPWLDVSVLRTAGIGIDGQPSGFVSSGDVDDNDGMLPLLPQAFWVARSATLRGTIARADRQVLAGAGGDTHVTLGGIAVAGPAADAASAAGVPVTGQVVAWTSTLVPKWPA